MSNKFWPATVLTGGSAGALDTIDGALLVDGDGAMVMTNGTAYFYWLDDNSGAAESSPNVISPDSNAGNKRWLLQAHCLSSTNTVPSRTSEAWSKSIGSGGDYATWAAMIADMPDLIAHAVTVTIKTGTTLTETCNLKNKHGMTNEAKITIQAEKHFPTSGVIPTADSATATTLRDAALATAAKGDDYFNGCWVFIVDGTGTDNGYVPITDYVDATGDVVVASWPGTQPDATSRYLIVGALIDGSSTLTFGLDIRSSTCPIYGYGIGFCNFVSYGIYINNCFSVSLYYCGMYQITRSGVYIQSTIYVYICYCGVVDTNTSNHSVFGGIMLRACLYGYLKDCGISDNGTQGVVLSFGGFSYVSACFGDANGTWGVFAEQSSQTKISGIECSGSSGNHSDAGTAGTAGADQAAAY